MRARRATECWLAGRRKACVEGTHRHMHARGVQLSLRLQAVEKRSPMRRKSKRCTCAPTQAILSAKRQPWGSAQKRGVGSSYRAPRRSVLVLHLRPFLVLPLSIPLLVPEILVTLRQARVHRGGTLHKGGNGHKIGGGGGGGRGSVGRRDCTLRCGRRSAGRGRSP